MLAALALVIFTPADEPAFGLSLAALILLLTMHAVYWIVTAPVNKIWLKGQQLSKAGSAFFRMSKRGAEAQEIEWTALRIRWEYSHIARAVLVTTALALLVTALAIGY